MSKQKFEPGNQVARGRGRPPGSRNKLPRLLQDLIVQAAGMTGHPRAEWVPDTDLAGKPLFEMRNKLDANGKPIKDKYGNVKRERCRDKNGKPIPIMKQERVFDGAEGVLGYLRHLAEEHPKEFSHMLTRVLPFNVRVAPEEDDQDDNEHQTLDDLFDQLESRGVQVEYFFTELLARRREKKLGLPGPPDVRDITDAVEARYNEEEGDDESDRYNEEEGDDESDRYN